MVQSVVGATKILPGTRSPWTKPRSWSLLISIANCVRAWRFWRNEIPDACFVVVGDNPVAALTYRDDTIGEIAAVISAKGLLSHVRLLGGLPDEDVVGLYQTCNVVVLPALQDDNDVEGFGIVLVEAAAAGKPVVATRVGGIPDAVEDGKTGLLTEPGDYERLSDAVISLLNDGQTKRVMGEAAIRRVQDKFCWPKIAAQYEAEFGVSVPNQN